MVKKYIVAPTPDGREQLESRISKGKSVARTILRAHILLQADVGKRDEEIAKNLRCSTVTTQRVRQRFVEEGLERAIFDKPKPGQPEKLSPKAKAHFDSAL